MLNRIQEEVLLKELDDDGTDIARKNEIALYFSDKNDERVVPILERLISNPRYKNHRGTFVYALKNFVSDRYFGCLGVSKGAGKSGAVIITTGIGTTQIGVNGSVMHQLTDKEKEILKELRILR